MKRFALVAVAVVVLAIAWWLRPDPDARPERAADRPSSSNPPEDEARGDVRRTDRAAGGARPTGRDAGADRARWQALRDAVVRAREARVRRSAGSQGSTPAASEQAVGTLDRHYIQAQMQEIKDLVRGCYEDALRAEPDLEGRLVVEFVIGAEPDVGGIVEESHIDETSPLARSRALSECVSESMYALELRAPDGGGRVTVRYPFEFRPTADAG